MVENKNLDQVLHRLSALEIFVKEEVLTYDDLLERLARYIDHLTTNDFMKLVQLLYRLDISEDKIQKLVNEQTDHPSSTSIAILIIEREQQKIQLRASFKKDESIPDDEKW